MFSLKNNTENLSYIGLVNIKKVDRESNITKDSFTIKNNGTKFLFKYLCDCLIQNFNAVNSPQFIDASSSVLTMSNNNIDTFSSTLTIRSRLSNIEVKQNSDASNYKVVFSSIILYDQVKASSSIKSLVLFPNKNIQDISKPLAFINMAKEIKLKPSEVLIIEWELQFTNAS